LSEINLLFIIYGLERGGSELRLLDFARYFPDNIKVHICVTTDNLSLLSHFQKCCANIQIIPIARGYLEFNKIWRIFKYVKANHISNINSFDLKGLVISTVIRLLLRSKVKAVFHSVDLLHHFHWPQKALLWVLLKFNDAVICNSKQSKFLMRTSYNFNKNIRIINNGININHFNKISNHDRHLKEKYNLKENVIVLGTIANFREIKNYPFLLRAFQILAKKRLHLKLICVGGGYLLNEIKAMAREYGIEQKILFTDYSDDVVKYLSLMDIFVLCSLREGLPNVLLQAMSMEIPIVSSNVGGCSEIINNMTNGILYPSNDLDKFIEAVEMLIESKRFAFRLSINARKTVEEKFSLNRMIENYTAFYKELSTE
jgi:glycosyltransferase involved in cell wall biosynthesis